MNNFLIKLIFAVGVVSGWGTLALGHYELNCPTTGNETTESACDLETQDTVDALTNLESHGLVTEKVYSYCLSSVTTPGQTGLQCRSLSLFYKTDGALIEDLVIDRFIGHQSWRSHTYTTYLVKQGNSSNYHRYVDHLNEGVLEIDQHRTSAANFPNPPAGTFTSDDSISVTFPGGFPKFTSYYFTDSLELVFDMFTANLGDGLRVYNQLNTPSEQNWDFADAASRQAFRDKEGLNHGNHH